MALVPADNWTWYKQIDITDPGASSANYQMKLIIYRGIGADNTATGEIYCDNNTLDWVDDIRFGTTNDAATATQLDQWIESSDAVQTVIWVEFPASGANIIYMFVGRFVTANFSDGNATFIFFDDFPGVALDLGKWAGDTGDCTVAGGVMRFTHNINATHAVYSAVQARPYTVYSRYRYSINNRAGVYILSGIVLNNALASRYTLVSSNPVARDVEAFDGVAIDSAVIPDDLTAWFRFEGKWKLNESEMSVDDNLRHTAVTNPPFDAGLRVGWRFNPQPPAVDWVDSDWVCVRKYTAGVEPSYNTFGAWISLITINKKYRGWQTNEQELTRD